MMNIPDRRVVEVLKNKYPSGSRVKLLKMDDIQAPPIGTLGTVRGVDDTGSIMVNWDTGSCLNVVYGEDQCERINPLVTICYGKREEWENRTEAFNFFLEASLSSEGSEHERYFKIIQGILCGDDVCTDE